MSALISQFSDGSSVDNWAVPYVATCIEYGLVKGSLDDNGYSALFPRKPLTRAEGAVMLYRTIAYISGLS